MSINTKTRLTILASVIALAFAAPAAFAQGGTTDILSRTVAQKLSETFGQQVVADNRAGANGIIGTDLVAKAARKIASSAIASPLNSDTILPSRTTRTR